MPIEIDTYENELLHNIPCNRVNVLLFVLSDSYITTYYTQWRKYDILFLKNKKIRWKM